MRTRDGVHRKGTGWVFRWREYRDDGTCTKRTSETYPTRPDAAQARRAHRDRLTTAHLARTAPDAQGMTLAAAALQHPSTQRDPDKRRATYLRFLDAFTAHSGVRYVRDLRIPHVQAYLDHLRALGLAFDTRAHRLLYVRRASRMAATVGLPDVLARLRLDERERRPEPEAWTLDELISVLPAIRDTRVKVALALGGFMGLRSSEIYRAINRDVHDGFLDVGTRTAKNHPSQRRLPIPAVIQPWIADLTKYRQPDDPLIYTLCPGDLAISAFQETTFSNWFAKQMPRLGLRRLPPKCLRKTFATWCALAGFPFEPVEAWMGHDTRWTASITSKHYLAGRLDLLAKALTPTAQAIDRHLRTAIDSHTKNPGDTTGATERQYTAL